MEENKSNTNLPALISFDKDTIQLIKETVMPKDATDKELELFLYQARRTGLDPLTRQIYCIKTRLRDGTTKLSIQSTIDGFRLTANRTGEYEGQTPPMWCGDDGKWVDIWLSDKPPVAAKIGVYRKGFKEPLVQVARFKTYAQSTANGIQYNWVKMPDLMLSKCAEALALRKAFPHELSGLYTNDEYNPAEETEKKQEIKKEKKEVIYDYPTFSGYIKVSKTLPGLQKIAAEIEKQKAKFSESDYNKLVKEGNEKKAELEKLPKETKANNDNPYNLINQSTKATLEAVYKSVTKDNQKLAEDPVFVKLYEKKKAEFGLLSPDDVLVDKSNFEKTVTHNGVFPLNIGDVYNRFIKKLQNNINTQQLDGYYDDIKSDPNYNSLNDSQKEALEKTYKAEFDKIK